MNKIKPGMPSSVIKSHSYVPDAETLTIAFISGKVYQYYGVSQLQYAKFRKAYSKGTYLNNHIKPNHPFKELL